MEAKHLRPVKDDVARRFIWDLARLMGFVLVGALGFMLIEKWTFLDSLYMTVITLTTVGYGETHPLDSIGKIYTIVLILFGAGVVVYVISDMVEIFLRLNLGARHMRNKIAKLDGHYIVCGYGRTGQEVTLHFRENKVDFVVIEQGAERAKQAQDEGLLVVQGDATDDDILQSAQIMGAKGIVCALPDDSANTFIALSAKGLKRKSQDCLPGGQSGIGSQDAAGWCPHGNFALHNLRQTYGRCCYSPAGNRVSRLCHAYPGS